MESQPIQNTKKKRGNIANLIPWKKGQSGNPGGRPKNSMKHYVALKLAAMTAKEKEAWLKDYKISGETMWKMGEGNPEQRIVDEENEEKELTPEQEELLQEFHEFLKQRRKKSTKQ